MKKDSIRLMSDVSPDDLLADKLAAIRVDNFQVTVVRRGGGIEVSVYNNGIPFYLKSMIVDHSNAVNIIFLEGE